jgi:cytochrome c biogenesis protein CcmG/thiol:disulfide interchange protein DsbE
MKRLIAFLPLIALLGLAVLFAGFSLRRDPNVKPDALVGHPLPAVALPGLNGEPPQPLPAAIQGPTYVNLFASWCGPCEYEHPQLTALSKSGVRVVGVAYKDDPAKTQAFLDRLGNPFAAVLTDREGLAGIELGVTGVPETYLVGGDGVIVAKFAGPLTPEAVADLEMKRLAAGGAPAR